MTVCLEAELSIDLEKIEPAWEALEKERTRFSRILDGEEDGDFLDEDLSDDDIGSVVSFIDEGVNFVLKKGRVTAGDRLQQAIWAAGFDGGLGAEGLTHLSPHDDEFALIEHQAFWGILAPFVREGSFFILQDYEGVLMRWRFVDGHVIVDQALRYVWDSDPEAASVLIAGELGKQVLLNAMEFLEEATGEKLKYCITDLKSGPGRERAVHIINQIKGLLGS